MWPESFLLPASRIGLVCPLCHRALLARDMVTTGFMKPADECLTDDIGKAALVHLSCKIESLEG